MLAKNTVQSLKETLHNMKPGDSFIVPESDKKLELYDDLIKVLNEYTILDDNNFGFAIRIVKEGIRIWSTELKSDLEFEIIQHADDKYSSIDFIKMVSFYYNTYGFRTDEETDQFLAELKNLLKTIVKMEGK